MNRKIDEEERIKRFRKKTKNKEFDFAEHKKNIVLVKSRIIKDVKVQFDLDKFKKLKCYLYHFDNLGISEKNIEEEFEGAPILIYKMVPKKISQKRKCFWCYAPVENLEEHIWKAHKKTMENAQLLEFQKALYQELLRIIRDTDCYMSMAFINASCQMCDNPIMKGRELCCSIPTSFRDRIRSLPIMGLTAKGINEKYFTEKKYSQILLAPKSKTHQYIDMLAQIK